MLKSVVVAFAALLFAVQARDKANVPQVKGQGDTSAGLEELTGLGWAMPKGQRGVGRAPVIEL